MAVVLGTASIAAQNDHLADGLASVASIAAETQVATDSVADSTTVVAPVEEVPLWKQKLYYGYKFDIYLHHNSRSDKKENGWSISVTPEIGWRLKERVYLGMRFGGTYKSAYISQSYINDVNGSKSTEDMRVSYGSWEVTPYMRYRMKTLFDGKVGIWMEAHLYTGMEFPRVTEGKTAGTDFDGLRHSLTYGVQLSPVITYQFNRKSTFQIFFSILSVGYSGSTFFYQNPETGTRYNEYTNDLIIFSGKLSNLLANQFTPGLYGLKFGVQKSF